MGLYAEHVFPHIMNRVMDTKHTRRIRSRVCATLAGEVVEIGFGTGLNLPHIPSSVAVVRAVDPLQRGRRFASKRLASSPARVEFVGLDGQSLPLEDASVDAALSTWTLCSIEDPVVAVREIARVLRPGGVFHFVEHGRSPDPRVLKWQRRLNPVQRRVGCGCTLDRDIPAIVEQAGFHLGRLETYYAPGEPRPFGWTFEGTASVDQLPGV